MRAQIICAFTALLLFLSFVYCFYLPRALEAKLLLALLTTHPSVLLLFEPLAQPSDIRFFFLLLTEGTFFLRVSLPPSNLI